MRDDGPVGIQAVGNEPAGRRFDSNCPGGPLFPEKISQNIQLLPLGAGGHQASLSGVGGELF